MIQSMKSMLAVAREAQRCVLAVNVYNLETVQAALEAAKERQAPIILAFGEKYFSHANPRQISGLIASSSFSDSLDIAIHLDHAKRLDSISLALESQFTSVMFDGSQLPLEQNIQKTQEVVRMASAYGASVEAELGYLNDEDGSGSGGDLGDYTRVEDAIQFVQETNVDALAVAIGNAHGLYKGAPHLDFSRLDSLSREVDIPLVLHGASGIPQEQIQKAISLGIAKINVNTEVALSGATAVRNRMAGQDNPRLEDLMLASQSEMRRTISHYLSVLGY